VNFGDLPAPDDVRQIAHWAFVSRDNEGRAVVVVDKKAASVYIFSPEGQLIATTPALMGSAIGDHTVPGIGDKPIPEVLPEERTTPAGRFVAQTGVNLTGEDVVWVDYDAAVSMHRVRPWVDAEQRLKRLASESVDDNRISYGCINVPVAFYETVLRPTVVARGAVFYVLPEVRPLNEVFPGFDPQRTVALNR